MTTNYMITKDYSALIGLAPVTVLTVAQLTVDVSYMTLSNVAPSTGGTLWLSRTGVAGVNAPGSFQLVPGESQTFAFPQAIPRNALSVVATIANTPLTVEVG